MSGGHEAIAAKRPATTGYPAKLAARQLTEDRELTARSRRASRGSATTADRSRGTRRSSLVTFDGDDPALVAHLERFGDTITRSHWWRAVTEGYCAKNKGCIGDGRPGRAVRLDDRLPAKLVDVDIGELLAQATDAGRLGPVDADTLLIVYLPPTVTVADALVPRYCGNGPRALHRALRLERLAIPYAVIPRCGGRDQLTASASQEILEATANPDPAARGFAFQQDSLTTP